MDVCSFQDQDSQQQQQLQFTNFDFSLSNDPFDPTSPSFWLHNLETSKHPLTSNSNSIITAPTTLPPTQSTNPCLYDLDAFPFSNHEDINYQSNYQPNYSTHNSYYPNMLSATMTTTTITSLSSSSSSSNVKRDGNQISITKCFRKLKAKRGLPMGNTESTYVNISSPPIIIPKSPPLLQLENSQENGKDCNSNPNSNSLYDEHMTSSSNSSNLIIKRSRGRPKGSKNQKGLRQRNQPHNNNNNSNNNCSINTNTQQQQQFVSSSSSSISSQLQHVQNSITNGNQIMSSTQLNPTIGFTPTTISEVCAIMSGLLTTINNGCVNSNQNTQLVLLQEQIKFQQGLIDQLLSQKSISKKEQEENQEQSYQQNQEEQLMDEKQNEILENEINQLSIFNDQIELESMLEN